MQLQCYTRNGRRDSISGRLNGLRAPASQLLHPAEVLQDLESWRADVNQLAPVEEVVALGHSCSQLEQKDVLALDLHTRWAEAGLKTHNSPTELPVPES